MKDKSLSTLLNKTVELLELRKKPDGSAYEWVPVRRVWAGIQEDLKRTIFSDIGIGARGVTLTLRPCTDLTLLNAIRWGDQFLFLTSIIPSDSRDRLEIRAARCTPSRCRGDMDRETPGPEFPGVLTEKYIGHQQLNPLAVVTGDLVLVAPKVITLAPGSWLEVDGEIYQVLVPHELDPWKNEYEIRRKEDC